MLKGSCLCGRVNFQIGLENKNVTVCYCSMCRKWSDGGLYTVNVDKKDLKIQGAQYIKYFDSSEWAVRAFCVECGTPLFYKVKSKNEYSLTIGVIEQLSQKLENYVLTEEWCIDQKPMYIRATSETKEITDTEIANMNFNL